MESVAILCPGPSLAELTADQLGRPDCIIAVNRAIDHPLAEGCDWWCAHDLWDPPLVLPKRAPLMGMVTCRAAISEGQAQYVPYPLADFGASRYAEPVRITTSAAIYWAAELIAKYGPPHGSIRLYGCDMRGTTHYDGAATSWNDTDWRLARACLRTAIERVPFFVWGVPFCVWGES